MTQKDVVPVAPEAPQDRSTASGPLQYKVYRSFSEVAALNTAWNDLACRVGDILCSYDWCEVWWRHFATGRRLEIHTLHDGPRLVAVLPLFRETMGPGGAWLRMVRVLGCDYTINTVGLAIEPDYAERFTRMLLEYLAEGEPWDILQIDPLRSYNNIVEPMERICARNIGVQTVVISRQDAWDTVFHLPDTYETFVKSLSSNARNDTRRRERHFTEQHNVEIETVTRPEQVQPAMDALVHLHQAHWTARGYPGQLRQPPVLRFHRELAQRLVATGQLVLLTLKADGQIVAATYGYHFGKRAHGLFRGKSDDQKWEPYSLGRIIHCHLIRRAIELGASELEDGRGVFEYKLRLGGKLYGERSLVLLRRGWKPRLRFWASLRMAYLAHVLCNRIWGDVIAPRLQLHGPTQRFYIRNSVLLQLYRRVRFRLFGGPSVLKKRNLEPDPRTAHSRT